MTNTHDAINNALDDLLLRAKNAGQVDTFYQALTDYCQDDPRAEALLRAIYADHFTDNPPPGAYLYV